MPLSLILSLLNQKKNKQIKQLLITLMTAKLIECSYKLPLKIVLKIIASKDDQKASQAKVQEK